MNAYPFSSSGIEVRKNGAHYAYAASPQCAVEIRVALNNVWIRVNESKLEGFNKQKDTCCGTDIDVVSGPSPAKGSEGCAAAKDQILRYPEECS